MSLQPVFRSNSVGTTLTLYKPATSLPSSQYLLSLAPRNMYLAAYRLLYRLRNFNSHTNTYCAMLRRRFRHVDFCTRRTVVLNINTPLTDCEVAGRLANTIAFVFNGTCATRTPDHVDFYHELVAAKTPRLELAVVNTILTMERQTPPNIKYDYKYQWVHATREFYEEASKKQKKGDLNRLYNTGRAKYEGFLQYETAVMALNDTEGLCL